MKVLYIGHYKEASGWGQVAQDNILALDRVGVDVVPRALRLGNPTSKLSERILELERKSAQGCDIVIQHVLPHYMKYDSGFRKNIGIFELESENIKQTSWVSHLKLMDELWVPCKNMENECYHCGIGNKIVVVPHTFDVSTYDKKYGVLNLPVKKNFVFYFVGEFNKRKHISALVQAFHAEFKPYEPVDLVLKTNKFGMSQDQLANEVGGLCNQIKTNLRMHKDIMQYKREILITTQMERVDILRLHETCDCFVCPSYGEAWCIPAWEAMAMGNILVSSATGAMLDYVDSGRNGFLVSGSKEPIFGHVDTFEEFGTGRERWFNISVANLMKTMRHVYSLPQDRKDKISMEAKLSCKQYDYSIVGQRMKELLSV
jgi:glycosyltransferase involved in cell wall biosynthesis